MATALVACDNVDEDERFIPIEGGTPTAGQKNILIEDFTGMLCINCPNAAAEIQTLSKRYEGRVVSVALHPEMQGFSGPLANQLATTYAEHYGIESLPKGMVDRQAPEDFDKWSTTVYQRSLIEEPEVNIEVNNINFAEATRQLTIDLDLTAKTDMDATLQVWLTESNITSFQSMPDGSTNRNYTHNHVLRDAVNGTWGEILQVSGDATNVTYTYTVPTDWDAQNMDVVAFVSNESSVLQVIEYGLFEDDETENPVAPQMEWTWNGSAVPSDITLQATDGVATLKDLLLTNAGGGTLAAQIAVEVIENEPNADIQFTLNGQALSQSTLVSLASAEVANIGAVATFAPNTYGTAQAKVTVTSGDVTKTVLLNFNAIEEQPQPQSLFSIVNNGEIVVDGATIEVNSTWFEFAPGMGVVTSSTNNVENGQQLMVRNNTAEDLQATYSVEVIEQGEALGFQLCAFGDCLPLNGTTLRKSGTLAANSETTTDWHAEFEYGTHGTAKTKFTVTVGDERQTIYVNFNYIEEQPAPTTAFSIVNNGEIVADGATIEVASTVFEFDGMGFVTSSTNNPDNGQQLMVRNNTAEDLQATYTVEVIEQGAAHGFQLCAFGDCLPLKDKTLRKSGTIAANSEITTDWHADFEYGTHGTAKTKFTVTVGDLSQTIYVNFVY